jgi:hypothetical protein
VDDIVRLWEAGSAVASVERPLRLLAAAGEGEAAALARFSLGARDRRILALRQQLFGRQMDCTADCPTCGAVNEFELDAAALAAIGDDDAAEPVRLEWQGDEVELRRLTTADLLAVADLDEAAMGGALAARALHPLVPDEGLAAAAAAALEAADPLAAISLELACAECAAPFSVGVDPAASLWAEIVASARRLLGEVHILAGAYGWSEATILALSPARRRVYLEMAGT